MRKLMWLTLGFGAACLLGVYVINRELLLSCAAGCLLLSLFSCFFTKRRQFFSVLALCLLGFGAGCGWYCVFYAHYLDDAVSMDGVTRYVTIRTSDFGYETTYGSGVDGVITLNDRDYQVRTYLDSRELCSPGTVLEGSFRFRVTTPDGAEEGTYHSGKGIFLLAYQEDAVEKTEQSSFTFREKTAMLRRQIASALEASFSEDTLGFARALLLGDTTDLDYETDTALKISGIRHVAAVSGLHVSILVALITTLTLRRRFLTAAVGFPVLILFAGIAGFTPSVTRACVMSGLMLLSLALDREYDGPTELSFAVLVMLLQNPLGITSVSFQLSVASVAGIFLFQPKLIQWLKKVIPLEGKLFNGICSSISVSLSAMSLTVPLCAWYFGMVSLIGIVTNLLTLWLISTIFYSLMAVVALSFVLPAAGLLLARFSAFLIRIVLFAAKILADVPMAAVYTCSIYITAWLIFTYLLLGLFLLSRNRKAMELICCVFLGLCISLLASWAEPMIHDTSITVLDVGQGQCILLQSGGKTCMVDCGGDSDEACADLAAETLLSQGITKLDCMILTHMDRDHAGGAKNLLSRIPAKLLVLPSVSSEIDLRADDTTIYAREDLLIQWENADLRIFAPDFPGTDNEKSLCILFDTEKCDILITGDRNAFGERMLLKKAEIRQVDVLVAGHHGSKHSTGEDLLRAVNPRIVCISAGEDNAYGHPAPALLSRLAEFGCRVYRTDRQGNIVIRR